MKIEIEDIDRDDVVLVAGGRTLGFRGRFRSPAVSGSTIFVPSTGQEVSLIPGSQICVETGQESISDFKVVEQDQSPCVAEQSVPCDYTIVGTVVLNSDNQLLYIEAAGFVFALDNNDSGGLMPEAGQRVSFRLHGLLLWDEHI
jgi:hypothetical protein